MQTWVKWTLISVPILIGGFLIYKKLKKPDEEKLNQEKPKDTPTPTPTPTPPSKVEGFPIKKGSKGAVVRELQNYLLRIDSKSLPRFGADASFGSETEGALKKITGKTSVDNQSEFDAIKNQAKTYKVGSPLLFQYNSPMQQVSPLLTIK